VPRVKKSGVKGEGDDPGGRNVDERWTGWSCSMGGGYRDGRARSKGMIRVDRTWMSDGRAGAAEIAWEEAIGTEERDRRG